MSAPAYAFRKGPMGDGEMKPTVDDDTENFPESCECQCGSRSFALLFTARYELSAECVACGLRGVVYDG